MVDVSSQEYQDGKLVADSVLGVEAGTASRKEAAKRLREASQKEPVEKVLANLSAEGMAPFNKDEITAAVDRVISGDKDAEGMEIRNADRTKLRTGESKRKFDAAKDNLDQANLLLENFKSLSDTQMLEVHQNLVGMFKTVYPDMAVILNNATTNAQKRALLENIFSNPAFARTLHGKLEKLLEFKAPALPAEIANRFADAKKELEERRIEHTKKVAEANAAATKLLEFTNSPGNGHKLLELDTLVSGDWEKKARDLKVEVETLASQVARQSQSLVNAERDANQGVDTHLDRQTGNVIRQRVPTIQQSEVATLRSDLSGLENDLRDKRKDLQEAEDKVKEIASLQEEKKRVEEDDKKAKELEQIAKAGMDAADTKYRNVQIEMDELKLGVTESKFFNQTETIIQESVKEFLVGQVKDTDLKRNQLAEESLQKETDEKKKQMDRMMKERWHKKGQTNRRLVEGDLKALLDKDQSVGEKALRDRMGMSGSEWDDIWDEKKDEAIESLLGYRLNMGKMGENESWMLFNRYDKTLFENAEKKKAEFREWMDLARKNNWIKGPGLEGLRNFRKEHPVYSSIILALLVGAGAQVLAPGWTIAKLAAGGQHLAGKYLGSHVGFGMDDVRAAIT